MTQALQLILSLSILIAFHEGGHFIAARIFKTRVEKFYLFFDFLFPLPGVLNFSLFKKKIGDTEYGLGWFPLGGYVQISGMIDESLDTEAMKKPAEPWEFRSKPAWQRLIIMLGGIIVNVLLAFFIYAMVLFAWGEDKLPMNQLKDGIAVDSLARNLGFKTGDKIISVEGQEIVYFNDLLAKTISAKTVVIERDGKQQTINLPVDLLDKIAKNERAGLIQPRIPFVIDYMNDTLLNSKAGFQRFDKVIAFNDSNKITYFDEWKSSIKGLKNQTISVTVERNGKPVVIPNVKVSAEGSTELDFITSFKQLDSLNAFRLEHTSYGFFASFPAGVKKTWNTLQFYIDQFKLILSPSTGGYKHVGGFISMGKIFESEWDWQGFWSRTAFISIILAFMNLLPIPALDGGHVLFTLWEMITRRAPSVKFLTYAQYVGMAFLLLLMVYANGNDIIKLFK
ncbi:MAG: RIP metalloprotease RseP [Bacteroidota bacterium]|nr:RIP metalloprotease RseP [Bacteroidota bacterium]